jgi:hypothetical protein
LNETIVDVENPFNTAGEFRVKLIESLNKDGTIKNPYTKDLDSNDSESSSDGKKISDI